MSGESPKDMVWRLPSSVPSGWKVNPADDEPGVVQVNLSARCIIEFRQPAGMGDEKAPDSGQVANDYSKELGEKAFDLNLSVTQAKPIMISANINDGQTASKYRFARVTFTAPSKPELSGTAYALRSGDYALIASAMCAGGEFTSKGPAMRDFIESATAEITF